MKLTLWSTPSRYGPATDQEFKAIAKQLNDSGLFDADVKSVDFEQYEKDIAAGKYGVYVKGWVPDYPDPDNFTQPFFGQGNVLGNNYDNKQITGSIIPETAAESDRVRHRRAVRPEAPEHGRRGTAHPAALAGQAVRRGPTATSPASSGPWTPRPSSASGRSEGLTPRRTTEGRP